MNDDDEPILGDENGELPAPTASSIDDILLGLDDIEPPEADDDEFDFADLDTADALDRTEQVQAMQALLDQLRDPTLHEIQDPRHKAVLSEIADVSFSNVIDVFETAEVMEYAGDDDDGNPKFTSTTRLVVADLKKLPEKVQRAIKSVKITMKAGEQQIEVQMYDKLVGLEKLMKHYGLYELDNAQVNKGPQGQFLDLMFGAVGARGLPVPLEHDPEADDL